MSDNNTNNENTVVDNQDEIINWEDEATAIINDVKTHVTHIEISRGLPSCESSIYLNLKTQEGTDYCVHVSSSGFRIVSYAFDTIDEDKKEVVNEEDVYETAYALLDKISPRYVQSFGNQLCKQLLNLQQNRAQFNEADEEESEDGHSTKASKSETNS